VPLTISSGKVAVLLRLPKATIKLVDRLTRVRDCRRTEILYHAIALGLARMMPLLDNGKSKSRGRGVRRGKKV
jgi:hypothetical protein